VKTFFVKLTVMFCYEIVYINNFGSPPAVQYRYPCRVIKIQVSGKKVADPGSGALLSRDPGWEKNQDPGS
jgi:hypothetical protein